MGEYIGSSCIIVRRGRASRVLLVIFNSPALLRRV